MTSTSTGSAATRRRRARRTRPEEVKSEDGDDGATSWAGRRIAKRWLNTDGCLDRAVALDDKDEHDARGRSCSEAGETRAAFGKSAQAHSVRDLGLLSPRVQFKHLYWAFVFTDSNRFHSRNLLKSELVYQNRLESSRKYNKGPV